MFDGQEVTLMPRTYRVLVCPACRRQAEGVELTCYCGEVSPDLEPVEVRVVALDDPRIIVTPALERTATRS